MNRAVFTVGNTIYEVIEYPAFAKHNGYLKKNIIVNYKNLDNEQDKRQVVNSLARESIYMDLLGSPIIIYLTVMLFMFLIFKITFGWVAGIFVAIIISSIAVLFTHKIAIEYEGPIAVPVEEDRDYYSRLRKELKVAMKQIDDKPIFLKDQKLDSLDSEENPLYTMVEIPEKYFNSFIDVLASCSNEERARFAHIFNILFDEKLLDSERKGLEESLQNLIDTHVTFVASNRALKTRKHA
mgnify:CR=1 FL=1